MAHRYPLEDGNLIAHHVFPPGHQALVDHLSRIISPRVDVDALLYNAV